MSDASDMMDHQFELELIAKIDTDIDLLTRATWANPSMHVFQDHYVATMQTLWKYAPLVMAATDQDDWIASTQREAFEEWLFQLSVQFRSYLHGDTKFVLDPAKDTPEWRDF